MRDLVRWPVPDLVTPVGEPAELVPGGGPHVLRRIGAELGLSGLEPDVIPVLLACHVEPRYQSVYAVLQDDLRQPRPTERLVHALLGRHPDRGRALADALSAGGRPARSGFVQRLAGTYAPLARPLDLPDDVVAALLGMAEPAGRGDGGPALECGDRGAEVAGGVRGR